VDLQKRHGCLRQLSAREGIALSDIPRAFRPFFQERPQPLCSVYQHRGPVRFAQHIGRPLSNALWSDITDALHARYLQVTYDYPFNELGPQTVVIVLDRDTNRVKEIVYQPWYG
jgi:hypothetical protein